MPNYMAKACSSALVALALTTSPVSNAGAEGQKPAASASGVLAVKSAYGVEETVTRLKADIGAKGIVFFQEIDQAALATKSGIELKPSVLLVFGNPPLGTQFIAANPHAGLDWPVRLLVYRDATGQVWVAYSDFEWIARRHGVTSRDAQFHMAAQVAASIAGSIAAR